MKILAIDSSAQVASVAICHGSQTLALYTVNNKNTHSETLLPMVESALGTLSMTVDDIDLFAVSSGPGSFTGVRIGVATVKGLAFGRGKPCVGVSTLEAIAYNLRGFCGIICPVMNARRAQVYTAIFSSDGKELSRLTEDMAISICELDELLCTYEHPVRLCGDGYEITAEALKKTEIVYVPEQLRAQSALSVAMVAERHASEATDDISLGVEYLRPSQAERERQERLAENDLQNINNKK